MWIHSIRLKNFKSYDQAQFVFPEPQNGRNLILIGAQNGHGKTTLLEAIYLGLYGKDAASHLNRAGLNSKETNYPEFLKSALYHEAPLRYGQYSMAVEIEIRQRNKDIQYGLKIERKWYFDIERKHKDKDSEVFVTLSKDGQDFPISEDQIGLYLNAYALPIDYAPFFFFDGEKIVQTAQSSGTGLWLNKALKGLLGVTLLDRLKESLKEYRSKCISENASLKMQQELEQAEQKLNTAIMQRDMVQEQFQILDDELTRNTSERDNLTRQLGGNTDIRTSQDFLNQKAKLDQEIDTFQRQIKEAFQAMPLAFLPRKELGNLIELLEKEKNRLNHEAAKKQTEGRVSDFWNAFIENSKVREVLGRSATSTLTDPLMKEAVHECWDKLFYPLPKECADRISHNYLSVNAHAEVQSEIEKLTGMPSEKISLLLEKIEKNEEERKNVMAEIEQMKGTNKEELILQLQETNQKISELSSKRGHISQNLQQHKQISERLEKEVERLKDNISNNNPKLRKSRRAGEVEKVITRLTEELMRQKVDEISEAASQINGKIGHDHSIHKIKIFENGAMRLFGRDGLEMRLDSSAGEMQILIVALVSALAEVTQYQAPLVIDTPLARLDAGNRDSILQHWADMDRQVILLAQDAEIGFETYQKLEHQVGRTYLVQAEVLDSGGKRTEVKADEYFKKETNKDQ